MFGWQTRDEGIVVVTMDDPDQSTNTMNSRFRGELPALVAHLQAEAGTLRGVVITSAKPTFFAGGDLTLMMNAGREDTAAIRSMMDAVKVALRQLETLGVPVVAAINGPALGGGYEIALACHHRVLLDQPPNVVGLPEVTLGLLPGAGGTVRTVRMLGLQRALQDILLAGQRFRPAQALQAGLVDDLVEDPDDLLPAAIRWLNDTPEATQPWDRKGYRMPGGAPGDVSLSGMLPAMPAIVRKQSQGSPAPAARALLAAAVEGAQVDFASAELIETRYITDLVCGPISTNIIKSSFFDMQAITRGAGRPDGFPVHTASKVVILGAGMMGAGIAYVCAKAGLQVVLKDVSLESAQRGKDYSARILDKDIAKGRSSSSKRDALLARITPTVDPSDAQGADLLIEAVFEDPALKSQVIGETLPYLATDAVIASNTSTLPITGLAESIPNPDAFIGLHFFSPVDKMGLLEIVVGAKTSEQTLARAYDIARQISKTPIVVNDSRGFFTSRVILKFVDESLAMVAEGLSPVSIERAATQAGYPVGALALVDELTLTLCRKLRTETVDAVIGEGGPAPEYVGGAVVDRMIDEWDRRGRSTGAGFYDYADGRKTGLWPGLSAFTREESVPFQDMQERMLFAEAIDTVRCLDEGVLTSVVSANVGSILGIGFPAWTGGVLQYINQYNGGLSGFVDRAHELAQRYGDRFAPPASLIERAAAGKDYQ
ncbi:3-hydroxyacyl-CoA dehydrogenase NAD-binding domain-containing protein [uncultured Jatrophihabitans sp.]|uniref:3-hydroxyacyl-CoA dehydrogenase NAD-binding domain-containing protein n=1 Tax=uncultured Jatrophihabitans sp. TaxID=1610747 RepID=UPI0035CC2337